MIEELVGEQTADGVLLVHDPEIRLRDMEVVENLDVHGDDRIPALNLDLPTRKGISYLPRFNPVLTSFTSAKCVDV